MQAELNGVGRASTVVAAALVMSFLCLLSPMLLVSKEIVVIHGEDERSAPALSGPSV